MNTDLETRIKNTCKIQCVFDYACWCGNAPQVLDEIHDANIHGLNLAVLFNNTDCVDIILILSDVKPTLDTLYFATITGNEYLIERISQKMGV